MLAGADQASACRHSVTAKCGEPEDGLPEDLRKVLAACEDDAARDKALTDALIKALQEVVHSTPCKLECGTWDPLGRHHPQITFQDLAVLCFDPLIHYRQHKHVVAG